MLAEVEETSLPDLVRAHTELYAELADELARLPPDIFFAPQGEHWSPAQHVDHLIRSVRPLAGALGWPRILLRLLFGRGGTSRSTPELVGGYLRRLAGGARARGRYRPTDPDPETSTPERQERLLARCQRLGDNLREALMDWQDEELDRYRLPHPLLGRLTVRELVAWSLYHGRHHRERIRERLLPPEPGSPQRLA